MFRGDPGICVVLHQTLGVLTDKYLQKYFKSAWLVTGTIQNCFTGWIQLLGLPLGHMWWVVRLLSGF